MKINLGTSLVFIFVGSAGMAQDSMASFSSSPDELRNFRAGLFMGFSSDGPNDTRNILFSLSGVARLGPNLTFQGDLDLAQSLTKTPSGDFDWSVGSFRGALQYELRPGLSFGPSFGAVKVEGADEAVLNYGVNALYAPADNTQIELGLEKVEDDDGLFAYAVVDYNLSAAVALEGYAGHYFDGNDSFDADFTEYRASIDYGIGNGFELYGALSGIAYNNDTFNDVTIGASYEFGRGAEAYIGAATSLDSDDDSTTIVIGVEVDFGQLGGAQSYGDRGRLSYGADDYAVGLGFRY
jgi:hypothetical protein